MTPQELKLKRKVQFIVASAMTLFFILVTVLAFQFAIKLNQRNQERKLLAEQQYLQQQMENAQKDIDYFNSQQFIEDYALRYLGWGKKGQKIFE